MPMRPFQQVDVFGPHPTGQPYAFEVRAIFHAAGRVWVGGASVPFVRGEVQL